ncbi:5'-nucleotidase C-terminal domain-containing protein [Streptosporangium sp. 'caverna']|uniref:5'-nucleotidase C-terminal domain-containing protein n=1 Tax=Streptosporangium sp. 'caverna' TaxID=2202249 RepID=UPI0013A6F8C0|nr:5'-nucleotidase [Streptosporangium sp. 'caverna']
MSTTVQVQAPTALQYMWLFSDGDTTRAKTYRVGGKGLKTVRLSASVKVTGDARGSGAVRLVGSAGKISKRASFAVDCAGRHSGGRDVWNAVSTSAAQVATPPGQGDGPTQNIVGKATIVFERTTASKCPLTFKIHGSFEGLPAGAQVVQYRLVGTEEWKTVNVPADHGAVFTTVLETLNWDDTTGKHSMQVEVRQPNGLKSNILYYFECGPPPSDKKQRFGVTAEKIVLTPSGGPLVELVADAYLDAVKDVSGAQAALVSRQPFRTDLDAGPVTYQEIYVTQPEGLHIDVEAVTGAQLKKVLAYKHPSGTVLTPSASLRYTVEGGAVTAITLNGAPVTDTQVIKVAANYMLMSGGSFPRWEGTSVSHSGPDDRGALASYLVKNSPVKAPKGDRVTIR